MKKQKIDHRIFPERRLLLELVGLAVLIVFSISQWPVIHKSLNEIASSDPLFLSIAIVIYWIALPLTALSFQVLSTKNINIWTTTLSQLAGSGPGRIIPGGLGRLGLSVIHLHKLGIETSKAIIITITSNIIGITVTVLTIFGLASTNHNARELVNSYALISSIVGISLLTIGAIGILLWLLHAHKTRKSILKLNRQWKDQIVLLLKKPNKILKLILIALLTLASNALIILFCAYALSINVSFSDALLALSAGVFIGGILPTPGGIGGVEAGIAGVLILFGYSASESTSIALLFRAVTYMQPLLPGIAAYLYLRERKLL